MIERAPPKFNFEFQMRAPAPSCVIEVYRDVRMGVLMRVVYPRSTRKSVVGQTLPYGPPVRTYYLESEPEPRTEYTNHEQLWIAIRRARGGKQSAPAAAPASASETTRRAAQELFGPTPEHPLPGDATG